MKLDKNYKVRVTPEQSRKIQELLFALGGGWFGCPEQFIVQYTERPCFYVSSDGRIHANHSEAYFNDASFYSDCTEIQADDLITLLTDLPESAENPLQGVELTPEFEAVEPKFKAGDKVYVGLTGKIAQVTEIIDDEVVNVANKNNEVRAWISNICHATPENYERLQATFTDIEFEPPPKELAGSDLCRAMLEKGWKYVPCYVHDGSDDEAINRKHYVSVKNETPRSGYNFSGTGANDWKYAVPIDPRTGEPLTQAVLDE